MAVAYIQEFPIVDGDLSTTNYDAVVRELNLSGPPQGLIVHTAGFDQTDGVFRIFDVWESREDGERFLRDQLNPIIERFMANPPGDREFTPPALDSWYELHDAMH